MGDKVTLQDEKIIDRWSMIIENGQGTAEQVYRDTENYIRESKAPGIEIDSVRVRPGWLKGLFGNERNYIMVTNEGMKDYRMFIGARDYGNNLDVSWYLTCEPGFFKKSLSNMLTSGASDKAISFSLDLFQQQDLNAYATVVHHCFLKAIEKMMVNLGQDSSKIDRKSKGFLGIS
ncbi:MAG: hypothetical protein ABIF11_00385 [Nitrospirota bacterium]